MHEDHPSTTAAAGGVSTGPRAEGGNKPSRTASATKVFTDPPYNVAYQGKTVRKLQIHNDALGEKFYAFLREALANLIAVCQGAIYVCMSSSELHTLYRAFTDAGGHWSTFLIWAKHHFTLGRSDYQRQYEPILYGWPQKVERYWCGDRNQGDVRFIARPVANREHPTAKPVELVERAIHNSSRVKDLVLDPFAGSGAGRALEAGGVKSGCRRISLKIGKASASAGATAGIGGVRTTRSMELEVRNR